MAPGTAQASSGSEHVRQGLGRRGVALQQPTRKKRGHYVNLAWYRLGLDFSLCLVIT